MKRLVSILFALVILAASVAPASAYSVNNNPWKTYWGRTYSHWVVVCFSASFLPPGGINGQFAAIEHSGVDAMDNAIDAMGGNLHYSWAANTCENLGVYGGSAPYVSVQYGNGTCATDGALACEAPGASGVPPRAFAAGINIVNMGTSCDGWSCGNWWVSGGSWPLTGYYDAYSLFLHELGHATTLNHTQGSLCPAEVTGSQTDSNPIMCPTFVTGVRRFLQQDDKNGIAYWY